MHTTSKSVPSGKIGEGSEVKGIIFDYGGTIDTNGRHWFEVLWEGYRHHGIDVSKEDFRLAYIHGERTLARFPLVRPEHNFLDLLRLKTNVQTAFLIDAHLWGESNEKERLALSNDVACYCYDYVLHTLERSRPVLQALAQRYPLVLVSNFYGNIQAILNDFRLDVFQSVVESAVVGVRKPDPRIFALGVEALGCTAREVVVIGDSYSKDIVPAHTLGCHTVWLRGEGWGTEHVDESLPTAIIDDFAELSTLPLLS